MAERSATAMVAVLEHSRFRLTYAESKRVTDGTRTRALRSHTSSEAGPVRPYVSVESAHLQVFQGVGGGGLSAAYRRVSARSSTVAVNIRRHSQR